MTARFKPPSGVSKAMRDEARGQPCTLRIPGVCNGDPETTVLCHIRQFGWSGMAQKPPDFLAFFGCSACHAYFDDRTKRAQLDGWEVLRALGETLIIQHQAGNLKMK